MKTFKELGLNLEIMKSLDDLEFIEPSPIQEKAIPFILKTKKDLIALAQTGTGKTAAFGLPILNQLKKNNKVNGKARGGGLGQKNPQAIILCPTRELCIQISQDMNKYAKYSKKINITPVYGGERIDIQIKALKRGTDIVVGTPGRVHDLIRRGNLRLGNIEWLVLDEADEMLDMGFKDDLDAILEQTPSSRQTLLFSATISRSVHSIAKNYMNNTEEISVGKQNIGAENVSHEYYVVSSRDRFEALQRILDSLPGVYGILFCRTRRETQDVAEKLKEAHYDAEAIHGEISQNMRTKIMARFKKKQIRLLVATDVAARGIDVNDLTHVINYNLPDQNESYTHRTGRTGRAKKSGVAVSLLLPSEMRRVRQLENNIGKTFEYKKIPAGEEVYKKQIDKFIDEVKEAEIGKMGDDEHFSEIVTKLKKIKKEDLIKYFISHKFSYLIDTHQNVRDLNAPLRNISPKKLDGDNVGIKINFGKKDGFDVKSLFTLINLNKNLKGIEIGRISLMPSYSIFGVEKHDVARVIQFLSGQNFRGKKIVAIKSNEQVEPTYAKRKKRNFNRSGGRGNRNKRNFRKSRY